MWNVVIKEEWYEIREVGVDLELPGRVWILFQVDGRLLEGDVLECVLIVEF